MVRVAAFTFALSSLAAVALAHGPHYLAGHELEQARLARRALHYRAGMYDIVNGRRSASGSARSLAKRGKCKASSSSSSSSTGSSDSSTGSTPVSSSSGSKATGTVGSSSNSTSSSSGGGIVSEALSALIKATGITGFLGNNGPAIGSWFRTDNSQDSTNGMSWCQTHYQDNWPGFAPDVTVMLNNFGGDYNKAATAYCGLEAEVTTPQGKTMTMYIVDGFDHAWVREPGSIDITQGAFAQLYQATDNKDVVIQGVTWKLTGNRKTEYSFKGGSS